MRSFLKKISVYFAIALLTACNAPGFLKVSGNQIVDGTGQPVHLKGFNVEFKDFMTVLGEDDIIKIADSGANSIRLALNYRDLEQSPFSYNVKNISLLDRVIDWCQKHGVYVILDLHLVPGIQNTHDFVVNRTDSADFWHRQEYHERFYALWTYLAGRYRDRTIVAGYDIMNEGAPPDIELYRNIMNRAAKKIRDIDSNHILIVEEAILPDGKKELILIEDKNTVYSIHFFYPPQFTFYVTTSERPVTSYPGKMLTAGQMISETEIPLVTGGQGWQMAELKASPPDGAELFSVKIKAGGHEGKLFIDDVHLSIDGHAVELPAPLVSNGSFEIDYPGLNWNSSGSCIRVSDEFARTGNKSVLLSNCVFSSHIRSSPITVKSGQYILTAWYRGDARGDVSLSLAWHKEKIISSIDKTSLEQRIKYALLFRERHNVPIYVGEFTKHANPSGESAANYLRDLLDIMTEERLHWSFWVYYSDYTGVGIHSGSQKKIVNPVAWDILLKYMK